MHRAQLISIIIPVFNDAAGVARTLEGISRQSWPIDDIEVIVVDNGSDEPIHFHTEYPFPVHLIRCETPGSYAARNAGAAIAKGEIFAFTDADCVPNKHWLQFGIASLVDGNGEWVVGGNVTFNPVESPTGVALYQTIVGFGQESNIRNKGFSVTANLICKRRQFETVGPFDERLFSGGDLEWAWRASTHLIGVKYQAEAIVYTNPRSTLHGAIRQARRVVAGRVGLRKLGLPHIRHAAIAKRRSGWQSMRWIIVSRDLGAWDKLRVLNAAILIRLAAALEFVRLTFGGKAERR